MKYWIIDELSKLNPQTGEVNNIKLHDAPLKLIASGNEFAAFQLIICPEQNEKAPIKISVQTKGISTSTKLYREHYVKIHDKYYPDPLEPIKDSSPVALTSNYSNVDKQHYHAFWIDLFIPSGTKSGGYSVKLCLSLGDKWQSEISIPIEILPISLPSRPTFTMEYNNFGRLDTAVKTMTRDEALAFQATTEYEKQLHNHHNLSREHWGVLNVLGYTQNGHYCQSMSPALNKETFRIESFKDYDKRFGPFLDGSAFKYGYGKGVPVSDFYLPFNFTWPAPWSYFPSDQYQKLLTDGVRDFEKHIKAMGWNKTSFHLMLNHKSRRSIFPYNGDEPTRIKDYGMLKYYLEAVNKGKSKKSPIHFRLDVGHYECEHIMDECDWVGNEKRCVHSSVLNGLSDFWVTSISHGNEKSIARRKKLGENVWLYQGASTINRPLSDQAQLLLKVYSRGADGYCFWSCNSWSGNPWKECGKHFGFDYLFYPGMDVGINEPLPSMRLKAARRTAMDIEYIELATKAGHGRKVKTRLKRFIENYDERKLDFMDDNTAGNEKEDFLKGDSWSAFRNDLLKLISNVSLK
jgi:hypothetical protein